MSKCVKFNTNGDKLEVIIRDSSFKKIFQTEVNISNKKEIEGLLEDLKNKGVDLIGVIKRKMIEDDGWFD